MQMILELEKKTLHCPSHNKHRSVYVKICGCSEEGQRTESDLGPPGPRVLLNSVPLSSVHFYSTCFYQVCIDTSRFYKSFSVQVQILFYSSRLLPEVMVNTYQTRDSYDSFLRSSNTIECIVLQNSVTYERDASVRTGIRGRKFSFVSAPPSRKNHTSCTFAVLQELHHVDTLA